MIKIRHKTYVTVYEINKRMKLILVIFIASIASTSVSATDSSDSLKFSTGIEYSSGSYGLSSDTDITYIPFSVKYQTFPWSLKLTVPFVRISGPGGVVAGVDGPIVIGGVNENKRTTESGLGDVVASAAYSLDSLFETSLLLDLKTKVKLGTANETKGLGTGENDYSIQLDIARKFGKATPFATLGHKVTGDPDSVELNDIWYSSLGLDYKINPSLSSGLSFDYKEATSSTSEDSQEGVAYLNWKVNPKTSVMGYGVAGFSDGSPDNGVGVQVTIKQ